jgi:hypothetical protein
MPSALRRYAIMYLDDIWKMLEEYTEVIEDPH